jgi:ribonuclease P protein component
MSVLRFSTNGGGEATYSSGVTSHFEHRVSFRFPKSARLARSAEFQKVKCKGTSFSGRFMVLNVLKMQPSLPTKIGIITSRRVGGAVVRNCVRRRIREIVRLDRPLFAAGWWLVIIARQRAAGASSQQLRDDWHRLAIRSSLLPQPS